MAVNLTTIKNTNQEIDIYIPELNIGIEFNGLYWHCELFKNENYHLEKTINCEKQKIKLLSRPNKPRHNQF